MTPPPPPPPPPPAAPDAALPVVAHILVSRAERALADLAEALASTEKRADALARDLATARDDLAAAEARARRAEERATSAYTAAAAAQLERSDLAAKLARIEADLEAGRTTAPPPK